MASDSPKVYEKVWLTDFFHGFPHINFQFKVVNSTFNPDSNDYKESLGLLLIFPVVLCLVLWLLYLVHFALRYCQTPNPRGRNTVKSRASGCAYFLVLFLILLSICVVGFAFYQNASTHDGVDGLTGAVLNINTTIATAETNIYNLDSISDNIVDSLSEKIKESVETIANPDLKQNLLAMLDQMRHQVTSARTYIDTVNAIETCQDYLTDVHDGVDEVESYRWEGTIAVLVFYAVQFVCMLGGLLKRSKAVLMITSVFGILIAILFWTTIGVYLGSSVGIGDFCMNPDAFFVKKLTHSTTASELLVYMECKDPTQPYQSIILEAQAAITAASTTLNGFAQMVGPLHLPGVDELLDQADDNFRMSLGNVSSILTNVGMCTTIHNYYIDGIHSACVDTLISVAYLLVITASLAVLSALIIFLLSCVWRQYSKRVTSGYLAEDDTDPFLPRPPPYEQNYGSIARASPRAWSERGALRAQQTSVNEEQVMFLRPQQGAIRDESPPPAYNSGQFSTQHVEAALASNYGQPRNH